jgi:hypothetical protein
VGKSINPYTQSGEAFNGFFGKQSDGKIRLTCALAREACMILQVNGLESIKRMPVQNITITDTQIAKAQQMQAQMADTNSDDKTYSLSHLLSKPIIDAQDKDWANIPSLTMQRDGGSQTGIAKLAYDSQNLYLYFDIADPTPWLNQGKDFTRLFKTGDAIDVQLSPTANDKATPVQGDLRIVIAQLDGKSQAVLMMPFAKDAKRSEQQLYSSPVMSHPMAKVVILEDAIIKVQTQTDRYQVEAAIPLTSLGLQLNSGMTLRGDFGFISSDAAGNINTARTYWSNPQTNLVNDLPSEAWLYPNQWAPITIK